MSRAVRKKIALADNIPVIPDVGYFTVVGGFAEAGAVNRFDDPKQIRKLAGLTVVENSSGKRKGLEVHFTLKRNLISDEFNENCALTAFRYTDIIKIKGGRAA